MVLELQSKWGNRWSRIASKLPGRTDNEIKNFWRTHMRKKAQEKKKGSSAVPSPTPSSISSNNNHGEDYSHASKKAGEESFYDTGGYGHPAMVGSSSTQVKVGGGNHHDAEQEISMDDIWKDIDLSEENSEEGCNFSCPPMPSPSSWEYSSDPLWVMNEESMVFPASDTYFLTG
ncbi:transcription factor MYB48-like isoform X2 [Lotus japonicus]|uniref:Uncharacterized protein n=2 Tax=Lotus japonicus TaxID=34305 RepID=I3TAJ0_LOTJA|nr:transcription factor MYB48-like isoform X2 [Lotus japonicus]AFK49532.1 unknown [Lotus japonicus]